MFYNKIILCVVLVAGSVCGMDRAIVEFKVDLLVERYFDGKIPPHALLDITAKPNVDIDKSLIQSFIRRGAELDFENEHGWTPLANVCSENRLIACKLLIECGAQVEKPFKQILLNVSSFNDAISYCGKVWLDRKLQSFLLAYLFSMKKLGSVDFLS
jgi:hypothetical protein